MVDPVDLFFGANGLHNPVKLLGGGDVAAEGFFDHEALFVGIGEHVGGSQLLNRFAKKFGGNGEVKDPVAASAAQGVEFGEEGFEFLVVFGHVDVGGPVEEAFGKVLPNFVALGAAAKFFDSFAQVFAKEVVAPFAPGDTDDRQFGGEPPLEFHLVEGGYEFALGEVAGGSEDD